MEIKAQTTVREAIKHSTKVIRVFDKYMLDCPGCKGADQDTIEKVAINNALDLKVLLKELNDAIKK